MNVVINAKQKFGVVSTVVLTDNGLGMKKMTVVSRDRTTSETR